MESELFLGSVTAVVDSCLKRNNLCLIPYVAIDKIKELGLVPLHWVDSFNIFDCILTKNPVQKHDGLYPLLQASKGILPVFETGRTHKKYRIIVKGHNLCPYMSYCKWDG